MVQLVAPGLEVFLRLQRRVTLRYRASVLAIAANTPPTHSKTAPCYNGNGIVFPEPFVFVHYSGGWFPVLCLSSVRELPVQVRELYAQGFVLVALHPFVHPCGPRHARIQRQLHRAVLLRETPQRHDPQPKVKRQWTQQGSNPRTFGWVWTSPYMRCIL
ncbi:unnamed protein product [Boreogadus saida]